MADSRGPAGAPEPVAGSPAAAGAGGPADFDPVAVIRSKRYLSALILAGPRLRLLRCGGGGCGIRSRLRGPCLAFARGESDSRASARSFSAFSCSAGAAARCACASQAIATMTTIATTTTPMMIQISTAVSMVTPSVRFAAGCGGALTARNPSGQPRRKGLALAAYVG